MLSAPGAIGVGEGACRALMLIIPAPRPRIRAASASVDTIEVFARHLPRGLRRAIEAIIGRRAQITPRIVRGRVIGHRIAVNRPPLAVLPVLADLVSDRALHAVVSRIDVAYDFATDDPSGLMAWLVEYIVLKWRSRRASMWRVKTTTYWCDRHKGRNVAVYHKRRHVVRFELRFLRAAAVRRAELDDLFQLPEIDPEVLFRHHVKACNLSERRVRRIVRRTVAGERTASAKSLRRRSEFVDAYRSRIAERVRGFFVRFEEDQRLVAFAGEDVNLDHLRVPCELTWPSP